MNKPSNNKKKGDYDKMKQNGLLSSGFIKPYVVNKIDENGRIMLDEDGNPIKEISKISRANPNGCQECQMDMRLEELKIEQQRMEEKKRKDLANKQIEEERRLQKKQRAESRAALNTAQRNMIIKLSHLTTKSALISNNNTRELSNYSKKATLTLHKNLNLVRGFGENALKWMLGLRLHFGSLSSC